MVSIGSDTVFYYIGTKGAMCRLLGWSGCLNVTPTQVHFVSGEVLGCWLSTSIVVASHIVLSFCQCSLCLCQCRVHPVGELIDCLQMGSWLSGFKPHAWMSTGVQIERGLLSSGVDMVV